MQFHMRVFSMSNPHAPIGHDEPALILDASVLINIAATSYCVDFFRALKIHCIVEKHAWNEVTRSTTKYPINLSLNNTVKAGLLQVVKLTNHEATTFLELVMSPLGEGESGAIAVGFHRNLLTVLDEKKGTNIASTFIPPVRTVSTLDLFRQIERNNNHKFDLSAALFNSLTVARMPVSIAHEDWVVQQLSKEQLTQCPSLRKQLRNSA